MSGASGGRCPANRAFRSNPEQRACSCTPSKSGGRVWLPRQSGLLRPQRSLKPISARSRPRPSRRQRRKHANRANRTSRKVCRRLPTRRRDDRYRQFDSSHDHHAQQPGFCESQRGDSRRCLHGSGDCDGAGRHCGTARCGSSALVIVRLEGRSDRGLASEPNDRFCGIELRDSRAWQTEYQDQLDLPRARRKSDGSRIAVRQ